MKGKSKNNYDSVDSYGITNDDINNLIDNDKVSDEFSGGSSDDIMNVNELSDSENVSLDDIMNYTVSDNDDTYSKIVNNNKIGDFLGATKDDYKNNPCS
jgi:hypothetical protein